MILRCCASAPRLKIKAATTFGNICALVDDTRDLLPFIPVLLPELKGGGALAVCEKRVR